MRLSALLLCAAAGVPRGAAQVTDLTGTLAYFGDAPGAASNFTDACIATCARNGMAVVATSVGTATSVSFTPMNSAPTTGCTCSAYTGALDAVAGTITGTIGTGALQTSVVVSYSNGFMTAVMTGPANSGRSARLNYLVDSCVGRTDAGKKVCFGSSSLVYQSDTVVDNGADICVRMCAEGEWNLVSLPAASATAVVMSPQRSKINNCTCWPLAGTFANNQVSSTFVTSAGSNISFVLSGLSPTATLVTATFSAGGRSLGSAIYRVQSCAGAIAGQFCAATAQSSSNGARSGDLLALPAVPATVDTCTRACIVGGYAIGLTATSVTLTPRVASPYTACSCNVMTGTLNDGTITVTGALAAGSKFVPTVTAVGAVDSIVFTVTEASMTTPFVFTLASPGCTISVTGFCGDAAPALPSTANVDMIGTFAFFDEGINDDVVTVDECTAACVTAGYSVAAVKVDGRSDVIFLPINSQPANITGCMCPVINGYLDGTSVVFGFASGSTAVHCVMAYEPSTGLLRANCTVGNADAGYVRFLMGSCNGLTADGQKVCLGTGGVAYESDTMPAGGGCTRACAMGGWNIIGLSGSAVVISPQTTTIGNCSCGPLTGTYANGVITGRYNTSDVGPMTFTATGFGASATALTVTHTGAFTGTARYKITSCSGAIQGVFCAAAQTSANGGSRNLDFLGGGNSLATLDTCATACLRSGYLVSVAGNGGSMLPRVKTPYKNCTCPTLTGMVTDGVLSISAKIGSTSADVATITLSGSGSRRLGIERALQTGGGVVMSVASRGRSGRLSYSSPGCAASTSGFCGDAAASSGGSSSSSSNAGAIAGGVIGGVVGAAILVAIVWYVLRKRASA